MGIGVVAINQLKGSNPAWFSQGENSAVIVGRADIPQIKNTSLGTGSTTLTFIEDPAIPTYYITWSTGGAISFTMNGVSHNLGSNSNGSAGAIYVYGSWTAAAPDVSGITSFKYNPSTHLQ